MDDFRSPINDCGLLDLGYVGDPFTWWNKQSEPNNIYERLDRALVNPDWVDLHPTLMLHHLAMESSDHNPIKISRPVNTVRQEFGDINKKLSETRKRLAFLDSCQPTEDIVTERKNLCSEIDKLLTQDEIYLRQRSRCDFLKDGDRNLKASGRRRRNKITKLMNANGDSATEEDDIQKLAHNYFTELFTSTEPADFDEALI
ncbi:hypothetical protein RND81_13G106800 [Saponaria officinalis]|uniref:Endonuclease/exonuclease/phosphatase domain-containing protein n=1 Tax=Saponaria officinalis TaxID=3572 RepID=A0AAW1H5N5_SAPOF